MTHPNNEYDQDRLTDVLDRASANEMLTTAGLVAEVQKRCKPQQRPRDDGTYEFTDCEDCGNEIGEGRLRVAIKNLYCVHCATAQEKRARLF